MTFRFEILISFRIKEHTKLYQRHIYIYPHKLKKKYSDSDDLQICV